MTTRTHPRAMAMHIAAGITPALTRINDCKAGYPTTTPLGDHPRDELGALTPIHECTHPQCTRNAPCPLHDPPTRDRALTDERNLTRLLSDANDIITRWTTTIIDNTTIDLATYSNDIWCTNCAKFGHTNVRDEGHTICRFCRDMKDRTKKLPNRMLCDIHATGRRISTADIDRAYAKPRPTPAMRAEPRAALERRERRLS